MDQERDPQPPPRPQIVRGELRRGQRLGDQRLRVAPRQRPQPVIVPRPAVARPAPQPAVVFAVGFVVLIALGTLALSLPVSSADGRWTPLLDALFTATSAVCLTGLVVVDTGTYWSGFGQVVILALFQLGGFGFMTASTLLLLLIGRRITLRDRFLLRETLGTGGLGTVVSLARRVLLFVVVAEVLGAVLLASRFLTEMEAPRALWWAVFHSASAFNNAGFDLVGGYRSLTPYRDDGFLLGTVALLMLFGSLSYTVVEDVAVRRRFVRLTLDSKLVLVTTGGLLVLGTLTLLLTERENTETFGGMTLPARLVNALFMTITRTGGFSSVDVGAMTEDGLVVLMALMFVGGAAGSTAGGIKVQTFSILFFAIVSAIRGLPDVRAFRRRVPTAQVMRALSVALLSVAAVLLVFFLLNLSEEAAFERVLFETISALGTVGLSTGITPDLTPVSRVTVIVAMFVGRLGPLTLALALAAREQRTSYQWPEETIRIG